MGFELYFDDLMLLIGLLIFPTILLFYLLYSKEIGFKEFFRFIGYSNHLSVNFARDLVDEYTVTTIAPNVVGTFANIIERFHAIFGVSETLTARLLVYHLTLLVISTVGFGILRIAGRRVLLAFLGEVVVSWALISGNLLFIYFLVTLYQNLPFAMLLVMAVITILYLLIVSYFEIMSSAKTYFEGAKSWKKR